MNKSVCFMSNTLSGLNDSINKWLGKNNVQVISNTMAITRTSMMVEYSAILIYKA